MRAIVFVNDVNRGYLIPQSVPIASLWMVEKPIILRICDSLVKNQIREIHWIYHHSASDLKAILGNGQRWSSTFHHHDASETGSRAVILKNLFSDNLKNQDWIIGHTDCPYPANDETIFDSGRQSILLYDSIESKEWSGWLRLSNQVTDQFPIHALSRNEILSTLISSRRVQILRQTALTEPLIIDFESFMTASKQTITKLCKISRNRISGTANIHSTAKIIEPVVIASGSEIGAGSTVGPFTAIGPNCVIEKKSAISNSVVQPETFVGRNLRLQDSLIAGNLVIRSDRKGNVSALSHIPVGNLSRTHGQVRREILQMSSSVAGGIRASSKRMIKKIANSFVPPSHPSDSTIPPIQPATN